MRTVIKVLLYLAFIAVIYCEEYNVPVMLHVKRARFLTEWKMAAMAQRRALKSYRSYQEESEYVRGGF